MSHNDHPPRRFPRLESRHAVLVRKLPDGIEELAPTRTIAVGGCCLVADDRLGVGNQVELLITIDHQVIRARGRVVYERQSDDDRCETGIEFLELDDDAEAAIASLFARDVATLGS